MASASERQYGAHVECGPRLHAVGDDVESSVGCALCTCANYEGVY